MPEFCQQACPLLGANFSLIFRLVVFSVHQKEEVAFLVSLCNYRNSSYKVSSAANTKNIDQKSYSGFIDFC